MNSKPTRTVLDAELLSGVRALKEKKPPLPLDQKAVFARALAEPDREAVAPEEAVSVKLMVKPAYRMEEAVKWVGAKGGEIRSSKQRVLLTDLPPSALAALDREEWVSRAEAARLFLPRLDEARGPAVGLDQALEEHGLSGRGVLAGIVDTGVDWGHPDFRDEESTRLELFVHARRPRGSSVSLIDEFTAEQINDALEGSGNVPQGDPHGHGTHCASIMAGNGRGDERFRGVAPEAAIVAVRSEPLLDTHTIHGIRRAFEVAGDRPAVVSLSLGGHLGPHDGTSTIENVISRESGPGRIVVAAAGNEGSDQIHWRGRLVEGEETEVRFRITDQDLQFVDLWVPRGDEVEVLIETPDGVQHAPEGVEVDTVFGSFEAHWRRDSVNRDHNLTVFITDANVNFTWRILLRANRVLSGDVHAWAGTASASTSTGLFPVSSERGFSIGMPATEERGISVGSFVSKNRFETKDGILEARGLKVGQLSNFSSGGPTRIGMLKPDIAAPGQYITAALASGSQMATSPSYVPRHHPSDGYITIQGTSMATPFVAGVIALMLEREPTLNPEEIQQRLRITAARDDDTGRVWSVGFGFGKLDADALLNYRG